MSGPAGVPATAPTVLVTDADRGSAVAIIRSLGRRGFRVIAADSSPKALGFRSRYTAERVVHAPPRERPAECLETLLAAAVEHDAGLMIPVTDDVIQLVVHARERFEAVCRLALADRDAVATVIDKSRTVELAERLGVPVPRTAVADTPGDVEAATRGFRWPIVLKTAVSPRYDPEADRMIRSPVAFVGDPAQLATRLARFEGCSSILVQEYCAGTGIGVEMLARRGRPLAAFQHRRLAEIPVSGGASAWRESTAIDPELYAHAERLVEAIGWTGLIMVEFKVGDDVRLMEINGRIWGSLPLAVHSGMDFPARLADMLLSSNGVAPSGASREGAPDTSYERGVRAFNLELILLWIGQVLIGRRRYPFLPYPRRSEALAAIGGILGRKRRFDIASRDDPRPGFAEISKIARKLGCKLRSVIHPGQSGHG